MTKKENELGYGAKIDQITAQGIITCGTRTRMDCCYSDELCRLEASYNPATGQYTYPTNRCCG